jgi:hypothetical protein
MMKEKAQAEAELEAIQQRHDEAAQQQAEAEAFIAANEPAERVPDTRADQLALLEWLTSWKLEKTFPDYLRAVYDDKYRVSIPVRNRRPDVARIDIQRQPYTPKDKRRDWYPGLDELVNLDAARHRLHRMTSHIMKNSEACATALARTTPLTVPADHRPALAALGVERNPARRPRCRRVQVAEALHHHAGHVRAEPPDACDRRPAALP